MKRAGAETWLRHIDFLCAEQAAERFFQTLAQSVPASGAASRVSSEQAIHDAPIIPFLAILPDCSLVLAALDREAYRETAPVTPPQTQHRSAPSDASATPPQSVHHTEPLSSSTIVYVPPPQPQYIPPDRPARYPIQPPQHSESHAAALQTPSAAVLQPSNSASGRLRRFGLLRMQSFRRADLEGIPRSLVWSIVSVEPQYCPWARPTALNPARSGSSMRLTAPSRSFRTIYGALGLLRGNSSTASRSTTHQDSITHTFTAPSPSHSSRTSMFGWRSPALHSAQAGMAVSMHEEGGEGATGPTVTAPLRSLADPGSAPYSSSHSHSYGRAMWLRSSDGGGADGTADSLQAALVAPWPAGFSRSMSLGHAIQLLELQTHRSIPEAGRGGGGAVDGVQ